MKQSFFLFILFLFFSFGILQTQAQEKPPAIYDPGADARAGLDQAINLAQSQGKHVLVMVGGNW